MVFRQSRLLIRIYLDVRRQWKKTDHVELMQAIPPAEYEPHLDDAVHIYLTHTERRRQRYREVYGTNAAVGN